jgi:hypothetical protein
LYIYTGAKRMRKSDRQVQIQAKNGDSPVNTAIFAILKADRRQVGDRRVIYRGGRRSTDGQVAQAPIVPNVIRMSSVLEIARFEPVGAGLFR